MKISKEIMSIGLIIIILGSTLVGCETDKSISVEDQEYEYRNNDIEMSAGYSLEVTYLTDVLVEVQPMVERLFKDDYNIDTKAWNQDVKEIGNKVDNAVKRIEKVEIPELHTESHQILEKGLAHLRIFSEKTKKPKKHITNKKEIDQIVYELGDGIKEVTESMDYRRENE